MESKDKVALVTGASRGIGRAIAEKFLSEGYKVYGTYFSSKEKMLELENKYGKDKFIINGPYDYRNLEDTNKLIKELVGIEFNTVICSAGIFSENDDFLNFDLNEFNKTMNCNFYTPLLLGIKLQNNIKNNGSIVIMSSNDAYSGAFSSMSYSISKSALLNLTKSLSVNYGRRGIRVNSVAPGAINTDMNTPEQAFDAPQFTPIERIGQPTEVADVVYFLASSNASFINGENITIDGGYGNVSVLLKNENSRIREYKGYDYIYEQYKNMRKDDTLIHIFPGDYLTWVDKKEEMELLNQNSQAEKRGAVICRIAIIDNEIEEEVKKSILTKGYLENLQPQSKIYLVSKSDVIKFCPDDYMKVGSGFGVFNNKRAFIDSYSSVNSIGYVVEGENLVEPMVLSFSNILHNIENGKIKQIQSVD